MQLAQKGFMLPIESPLFTKLDADRVQCDLCPKRCVLSESERASCRVRENNDGTLYTLSYGNPALVEEEPIERKPFYHVLPGSRVLSISTAGCNLSCKFCEFWDMALVKPEEVHAYDMPPDKVIEIARDAKVSSISYAFGEPVIFYEYMFDTARLAKKAGFLNLAHTAAYIEPKPLQELSGYLDAVNIDLKGFDPVFYREVVGGELEPVLESLRILHTAGVHIEITNLVIPTLNDNMQMIDKMCRWIVDELGPETPLHFSRFYPLYKLSALPQTPVSLLDRARSTAMATGLNYVYVAKVRGHDGENTFCPNCRKKVIERVGFIVSNFSLINGSCKFCGTEIVGRWS